MLPRSRLTVLVATIACAWLPAVTSSCGGGPPNAQGGLANAPSINRPASEGVGHDVVSNGPEACGPTAANPEGSKLPQCVETASSSARPARPPPK